jgi:hypothetical protein
LYSLAGVPEGVEELNLSNTGVPLMDLGRFQKLTKANLSDCHNFSSFEEIQQNVDSLIELNLSGSEIESFEGLEHFPNLKKLILRNCKNLNSLQYVPVSKLTNLSLINTGVKSLTELEHFTNLKGLMIVSDSGSLKKDDFNGLSTHPNLKKILISHREVELKKDLEELFAGSGIDICVSSEY